MLPAYKRDGICPIHPPDGDDLRTGTGLVRQHSLWPKSFTLWEAAALGMQSWRFGTNKILFEETAKEWGLDVPLADTPVGRTDAAALQRAELIAALMRRTKLLILDEPSAAWEEGRSREFSRLLEQFEEAGMTVLIRTVGLTPARPARAAFSVRYFRFYRFRSRGPHPSLPGKFSGDGSPVSSEYLPIILVSHQ